MGAGDGGGQGRVQTRTWTRLDAGRLHRAVSGGVPPRNLCNCDDLMSPTLIRRKEKDLPE